MNIFSFRADCVRDVEEFFKEAEAVGITGPLKVVPDKRFPDCEVEIQSTESLEYLRDAMRRVTDGHIMVQTLRQVPMDKNDMSRDTTL